MILKTLLSFTFTKPDYSLLNIKPITPKVELIAYHKPNKRKGIKVRNAIRKHRYRVQYGVASHYHEGYVTATGERFNSRGMTAASNVLPMGTKVRVTNLRNGRSVRVRINDTGAFSKLGRVIDLSTGAFSRIAPPNQGLVNVKVEVIS